jgi:hypothetical protein
LRIHSVKTKGKRSGAENIADTNDSKVSRRRGKNFECLTYAESEAKMANMQHSFIIAEQSLRLWQNRGESYEHVLMKALGFAMFIAEYPDLQVEVKVGLRYKPDLVSRAADGSFDLWGECGINSVRKTNWILKHASARLLVLFKIGQNSERLVHQLREMIPEKYRSDGRLQLINFSSEIRDLTASKQIATVSDDWFESVVI